VTAVRARVVAFPGCRSRLRPGQACDGLARLRVAGESASGQDGEREARRGRPDQSELPHAPEARERSVSCARGLLRAWSCHR
jgi:hypothetical protein